MLERAQYLYGPDAVHFEATSIHLLTQSSRSWDVLLFIIKFCHQE